MKLTPREKIQKEVRFLLAMVAPIAICEAGDERERDELQTSTDNATVGFDQGEMMIACEMSFSSIKDSEAKFINERRETILSSFETFF